jgi:hypothetical protein
VARASGLTRGDRNRSRRLEVSGRLDPHRREYLTGRSPHADVTPPLRPAMNVGEAARDALSPFVGAMRGVDVRKGYAAAMSEDHTADRARLVALVPVDGTAVGNTALIRQLGWSENRYWYARDSLLEAGALVRAKGRGGAVRRAHPDDGTDSAPSTEAEIVGEATLAYVHEADLYPKICETLQTFWAKERQIEPLAVEITAAQGRRAPRGSPMQRTNCSPSRSGQSPGS